MKYCPITETETRCTDHCKECAKEYYCDLKKIAGKAEYVGEEFIKCNLGSAAFELMREHGLIEYCTTIQDKKMYAI